MQNLPFLKIGFTLQKTLEPLFSMEIQWRNKEKIAWENLLASDFNSSLSEIQLINQWKAMST